MFTKLLLCSVAVAILSIAKESAADTYEIIEIDPRQFNQKHQQRGCQQYENYYKQYYDNYYNKYYNNHYNQYYFNYYKQYYQKNQQQQINVNGVKTDVEWVCTNPKTKDQMIIGSQNVPVGNNGHQQWKPQPNYPQQQYPQQNQPQHRPQPSFPQQQYPQQNKPQQQPQPSYPSQNYPNNGSNNQTPQTSPPNTNGDGLIDIRFGDE